MTTTDPSGPDLSGPETSWRAAAYGPAPGAPPKAPARRWLIVIGVVWALVLAGGALWAYWKTAPTDREQTTIATAKHAADRAIGETFAAASAGGDPAAASAGGDPAAAPAGGDPAAGGEPSVAVVSGFERRSDCRISLARGGVRYQRSVTFYTRAGAENALLEGIAAGLPASYHARVSSGTLAHFTVDAGDFITLSGGSLAPGQVRVLADTGCRQSAGDLAEGPAIGDRAPIDLVLSALGGGLPQWRYAKVTCPNGNPLWTQSAMVRDARPGPLPALLAPIAPGNAVQDSADLYVFRHGAVGVVVSRVGGTVTVSATGGC